jgi:hypothetical protein
MPNVPFVSTKIAPYIGGAARIFKGPADTTVHIRTYSMSQPTEMADWLGTRHNYAASIAYLDGHSELHRWTDQRTKGNGLLAPPSQVIQVPDNADIGWIQQRTSDRTF